MEFIHKIRALQIGKRKTFRRVLLAEILLILLGIVGLFGRNEVYEYRSLSGQYDYRAYFIKAGSLPDPAAL